jgi:hypothetical protein
MIRQNIQNDNTKAISRLVAGRKIEYCTLIGKILGRLLWYRYWLLILQGTPNFSGFELARSL